MVTETMGETAKVFLRGLPFDVPFTLEEALQGAILVGLDREIKEGEEVIGDLTEKEQLALAISFRFLEESERAGPEIKFARSEEERSAAEQRRKMSLDKANLMRDLFWAMVRDNHDQWDKPYDIGVRGSQLVKRPLPKSPFEELFRSSPDSAHVHVIDVDLADVLGLGGSLIERLRRRGSTRQPDSASRND